MKPSEDGNVKFRCSQLNPRLLLWMCSTSGLTFPHLSDANYTATSGPSKRQQFFLFYIKDYLDVCNPHSERCVWAPGPPPHPVLRVPAVKERVWCNTLVYRGLGKRTQEERFVGAHSAHWASLFPHPTFIFYLTTRCNSQSKLMQPPEVVIMTVIKQPVPYCLCA